MPKHFLPPILSEFFSTPNTFILAGGCLLLLVILVLTVKRLSAKKEQSFNFRGNLTAPEHVFAALDRVLVQRQSFEMQSTDTFDTNRPTLKCFPVSLTPKALTLETFDVSLSAQWLRKPVTLSFRIENKGKFSYYICTTTIREISTQENGCVLVFDVPELIEARQQRSFLRIAPAQELIYGAAIWHGDTLPDEEQTTDLRHWLKPSLFYIPGTISQFTIPDLSANGIQLYFPKTVTALHELRLSTLDRFILLLDLYDPEKKDRLRLWLLCKTQRIALEETSEGFYTGAQFLAWGKPRTPFAEEAPGAIEWFRVPSSREVEPLSHWIMHRHLDNFRLLDDNKKQ